MSSEVFNTYRCDYCQYQIDGLRVRCTACTSFEICLQCFTNGAEIGPHKNDHPYQFVGPDTMPHMAITEKFLFHFFTENQCIKKYLDSVALDIFGDRSGWSAREVLSLLNAIEHFSYGNWKDIAQHIGTRNADETKEEFVNRFLEGSIGRATWEAVTADSPAVSDVLAPDRGPLAPHTMASLPPLDIRPHEAHQLDYYPLRDDFEIEYDNMAETLVSSLTLVNGEDDSLDIALKLTQVDMYNERLRERERRHRVVRDYQLIANFFRQRERSKKKISKEEKILAEKCLKFSQFHTSDEHSQFLGNITTLRKLQKRLTELLRYRKYGITKYDDLPDYEQGRISRESPQKPDTGGLVPLEEKKRKKRHKKLLFTAKKIHVARRPFFRFASHTSTPILKRKRKAVPSTSEEESLSTGADAVDESNQ